jgi:glycosyltransferase involved in cell wall biosynthesis
MTVSARRSHHMPSYWYWPGPHRLDIPLSETARSALTSFVIPGAAFQEAIRRSLVLTVMFSSRNGGSVLERTLSSLAAAQSPTGGWKLVAVDNASTDETLGILRRYTGRLPLTVLVEPQAGKNRALNRALRHGEGDLYVFCDDDVIVDPDWLVRWREVADEHPQYDMFAGVTEPLWPFDPPAWVLEDVDAGIVFAANGHKQEGPCDGLALFGTNMAIRARLFEDGTRFNVEIGPSSARAYPMGSETELVRRLSGAGHLSWFANAPCVKHIIRAHQLARPSILMRGYRWGRGQAHMRMPHSYSASRLQRKNLLRWSLYPLLMRFYDHKEAWARQWEWAIDQGYEDGMRESVGLSAHWLRRDGTPRIARRFRKSRPRLADWDAGLATAGYRDHLEPAIGKNSLPQSIGAGQGTTGALVEHHIADTVPAGIDHSRAGAL